MIAVIASINTMMRIVATPFHSLLRQGDPRQASGYDAAPYLQGPGWSFRLVDGHDQSSETRKTRYCC